MHTRMDGWVQTSAEELMDTNKNKKKHTQTHIHTNKATVVSNHTYKHIDELMPTVVDK